MKELQRACRNGSDAHLTQGNGNFRKINPTNNSQRLKEASGITGRCCRSLRFLELVAVDQKRLKLDFFGAQSEFPRLHIAAAANDEVKQDHAGLFAFDTVGGLDEWRIAMLANPSHT